MFTDHNFFLFQALICLPMQLQVNKIVVQLKLKRETERDREKKKHKGNVTDIL